MSEEPKALRDEEIADVRDLAEWADKGSVTTFFKYPLAASHNDAERYAPNIVPKLLATLAAKEDELARLRIGIATQEIKRLGRQVDLKNYRIATAISDGLEEFREAEEGGGDGCDSCPYLNDPKCLKRCVGIEQEADDEGD